MKKKNISILLFVSFLLALFYVFGTPFLDSNNQMIIEEAITQDENMPLLNVVNYYTGKPLASRFLLSQNEIIEKAYEDITFPYTPIKKVNVCVLDNFEINEEKEKYSHGELVSRLINKHYKGDLLLFHVKEYSYGDYDFDECDVINYSMNIYEEDRNSFTLGKMKDFMENYQGIMVVASGNQYDTVTRSEWAAFRELYGEECGFDDRVIIVGQGKTEEDERGNASYVVTSSYGEEIDTFVFNFNELIEGKALKGSSFSTPIITGVVANLLSMNVPVEKVKEIILSRHTIKDQYGIYDDIFSTKKTYEKLKIYVDENNQTLKNY